MSRDTLFGNLILIRPAKLKHHQPRKANDDFPMRDDHPHVEVPATEPAHPDPGTTSFNLFPNCPP